MQLKKPYIFLKKNDNFYHDLFTFFDLDLDAFDMLRV